MSNGSDDVRAEVQRQLRGVMRRVNVAIGELRRTTSTQGEAIAALQKETSEQTKKLDNILLLFSGTSRFFKFAFAAAAAVGSIVEIYRAFHH